MPGEIDKKSIANGFIAIIIGLLIYLFGPIEFRGALVNKATGIIIGLFGLGVASIAISRKKAFGKYQTAKMQCQDCGEDYYKRDVAVDICPKCNGKLIDLE